MNRRNILVIHRWPDKFVDYDSFIDPEQYCLHYFVNSSGKRGINFDSELTGKVFELEDLNQLDELIKCTGIIISEFGKIDLVIAPSESDLIQAAQLRTKFNITGMQEEVQFFRDKVAMKTKVKKAGLPVPNFLDCATHKADILTASSTLGYPLIIKPKDGSGSEGVDLIYHQEELETLLKKIDLERYELEEYILGTVVEIDGLVYDNKIVFIQIAKYFNTCLDFKYGKPLGFLTIEDEKLKSKLRRFTQKVLTALELNNSAFHLELILKNGQEPVFLEIGARVGGGGIPFLIKDTYNINLVQEWIKIQLGQFQGLNCFHKSINSGCLMMPEPPNSPCKVLSCKPLQGTISTLYKEVLPEPGEILDGEGGYNHISGTFFYKSNSAKAIEADMYKTIQDFEISYEKVTL